MDNSHEQTLFQISDNETFKATFADKALTKELLELILEIEIDHIEFVQTELQISASLDAKGIRMDVYVKDSDGQVYNVEMQTYKENTPLKRARYYQSMMDVDNLNKGRPYRLLPKSYVIFICTFDVFGKGLAKYRIRDWCEELGCTLDDMDTHSSSVNTEIGRKIIFLNASAQTELPSSKLEGFLSYVSGHTIQDTPEFDFARKVEHRRAEIVDNREWRSRRMTLEQELLNRELNGRAEGIRLGLEQGLEQGRERLEQAVQMLAKEFGFDEQAARELVSKYQETDNAYQ